MAVDITRRRENAQGRVIWFGEVEWEGKLEYNIYKGKKITLTQ